MESDLPQEKLIVGLISFGLGLILSGRFLFGLLPIAAGIFFYIKNRAAYAGLEKRLISMIGAGPSSDARTPRQESPAGAGNPDMNSPTASAPVDNWYYERAGAAIGPLKESEIRILLLNREISSATLVYHPIFGDEWRQLENTHFSELSKRRPS